MSRPCRTVFLGTIVSQTLWLLLARWFAVFATFEHLYWEQDFYSCDSMEAAVEPAANLSSLQMVHVAYASDSRYLPWLLLSMVSLARHLEDPEHCTIHVVLGDEDMKNNASVLKCFESALEGLPRLPRVHFHPRRLDPVWVHMRERPRHSWHRAALSPVAWTRLHLDQYLPNVSRVLYLDTDTIVKSDIGPLFRIHLRFGIAAALDIRRTRSKAVPNINDDLMSFAAELNVTYDNYVNTGVMLIDLERWRADKMRDAIERWALKMPSHQPLRSLMHDQDIINVAFGGRVDVLDWRWNALGMGDLWESAERCVDEARILHLTPQNRDCLTDSNWLRSRTGLRMKPYMEPLSVCLDLWSMSLPESR